MISLVVSRTSVSEGLALVAIQIRVLVSSWVRESWFLLFSISFLPKTTAMGVISKSEAKLMSSDVLRDSLDGIRKTMVRMMLVISAWIGSKKRAKAKTKMVSRKKKGELRWPVEKIMRRIRLKKTVVVIRGWRLVKK
jgi:hypothetical protein